jgi:hypothetical protein
MYFGTMQTILSLLIAINFGFFAPNHNSSEIENTANWNTYSKDKYASLGNDQLTFQAFDDALKGYSKLKKQGKLENAKYLTVIDFSKPSNEKRLFLIDTDDFKIVHETYCAHGQKTGSLYAKKFSNIEGSHQSSPGFYITENTYKGKHDHSLRLKGIEKCNSNAKKRAIVMHGANYATESFLKKNNNVLGRSWGCPAVPQQEAKMIIEWIKEGSCMYIYHDEDSYRKGSTLLKS